MVTIIHGMNSTPPPIAHVPVAEAKAKFSEMLRRAGDGEEIVVTSHGRPVARIMPPDNPRPSRAQWIADLMELRRGTAGGATRDEVVQWIHDGRRF